jgi:hypothetical protein
VGLLGVELDDHIVIRPVKVDGDRVDPVVRDRARDVVEAVDPPQEASLPAAAGVRETDRLQKCGCTALAAMVEGEPPQIIELDQRPGGGFMDDAIDRPSDGRKVKERLLDVVILSPRRTVLSPVPPRTRRRLSPRRCVGALTSVIVRIETSSYAAAALVWLKTESSPAASSAAAHRCSGAGLSGP